jgi:hypothetical protein
MYRYSDDVPHLLAPMMKKLGRICSVRTAIEPYWHAEDWYSSTIGCPV